MNRTFGRASFSTRQTSPSVILATRASANEKDPGEIDKVLQRWLGSSGKMERPRVLHNLLLIIPSGGFRWHEPLRERAFRRDLRRMFL